MPKRTLILVLFIVLFGSGLVWAATYHSITVDGNLSDFAADEKLPSDPLTDSVFGSNNELQLAYLTWDANNLYLGFNFKAWGTAVMYLLDLNSSTGATSFCPSAGYKGAFPANFITSGGTNADLMVALYVPNAAAASLSAFVYKVTAKNSTDITKSLSKKPVVKFTSNITNQLHSGAVELALPWNTIYSLGSGKVPKCAKLGLAGVLRGKNDSSALGDANPNNTLGDKGHTCWTTNSKISTIKTWHKVDLDKSCAGVPDKAWMPGSNKPKSATPDAGLPDKGAKPDSKMTPDLKALQDKAAAPDKAQGKKDGQATPDKAVAKADQKSAKDKGTAKDNGTAKDVGAAKDKGAGKDKGTAKDKGAVKDEGAKDSWGEDSGYQQPPETSEGCACSASGQDSLAMGLMSLSMLAMAIIPRRRRKRGGDPVPRDLE